MADVIDFNLPGPSFGIFVLVGIAFVGFTIWMLVDAINRPPEQYSTPGARTGWIAALIVGLVFGFGFLGFVIAIAYFLVVRVPARAPASQQYRAGVPGMGEAAPPRPGPATPPPPPGAPAPPTPPPPTHCRNCGTKVVAGARYCHSCGAPTTQDVEGK